MRTIFFLVMAVLCGWVSLDAQPFFPVKINKKWGLIDTEGRVVVAPRYEAIGDFKHQGYAVMQRGGQVGLLGENGREVLSPAYEDLKVLTSDMIAVMQEGIWRVVDLAGRVLLPPGYDMVDVLTDEFLAYRKSGLWGIIDREGCTLSEPAFEGIDFLEEGFFLTEREGGVGLLGLDGRLILPAIYDELRLLEPNLIFFKKNNKWGVTNGHPEGKIAPRFDRFELVSQGFVRLIREGRSYLYSSIHSRLLIEGDYDDFYPLAFGLVMTKKDRLLGLVNAEGDILLPNRYNEIQVFGKHTFRVNYNGKWGIVDQTGRTVLRFDFSYIAPLKGLVAVLKQGRSLGVINHRGEMVVPVAFDRIELSQSRVKAFNGKELSLFYYDAEGNPIDNQTFEHHFTISIGGENKQNLLRFLESDYVLEDFEWYYSPQDDKWGLRRLEDGEVQINPQFDRIRVSKEFGFTLVGIDRPNTHDFERTTYRFESVYGMVNNDAGLLVTEVDFWDVRLRDFEQGLDAARCIFSNGRHGLVSATGVILVRDFAYIGEFKDGLARASMQGQLSGSIAPEAKGIERVSDYLNDHLTTNYMLDYTEYDREFKQDARLVCEQCKWGYIIPSGELKIGARYAFARDFVNEVGIVECNGKWGLVSPGGKELIPCQYDGINFLENTDNQIIRLYKEAEKYGLIDTLGQLKVRLEYDEIGSFSEGRLAVKRNGLWGFVDRNGREVIPCRFRAVNNFSEGLAAVKVGRRWGFIDKLGNLEINFQFIRTGNFENGLAWFYEKGSYGYINRKGHAVIEPQFEKAYDFEGDVARIQKDQKSGLIDAQGRLVLRPKFISIYPYDENGLAKVSYGNDRIRYGLIDQQGNMVTSHPFQQIRPFYDGLAAVRLRGSYGFIDTHGKLLIDAVYSKVSDFSDGRAAAQQDGVCGYIDREGQRLLDFEFSKCLDFEDGKAVVYKGYRRAGLIDSTGHFLIKPSINRLYHFSEGRGLVRDENYRFYYITEQAGWYDGFYQKARSFQHGMAVVQVNGKWGIINQKGIEIIPPKYDKIEQFENGYAKVRIQGFNGLSNLKGELIVQPDYEYISYAGEGLFRVEQGDKVGYFDMAGNWVWGLSE